MIVVLLSFSLTFELVDSSKKLIKKFIEIIKTVYEKKKSNFVDSFVLLCSTFRGSEDVCF